MKNKQVSWKFRCPQGRFNAFTICEFEEDGHSYSMPYGMARFIRRFHGGSIKTFIENVLLTVRNANPHYATDPEYIRLQALLPQSLYNPFSCRYQFLITQC